jgi:hypothetical protein
MELNIKLISAVIGVILIFILIVMIIIDITRMSDHLRNKGHSDYKDLSYQSIFKFENSWYELLCYVVHLVVALLIMAPYLLDDNNIKKTN